MAATDAVAEIVRKQDADARNAANQPLHPLQVRMKERQEKLILEVSQGTPLPTALAAGGINRKTYEKWRQRDREALYPWFCQAIDAARSERQEPGSYTRGFAAFRQEFFGFESIPVHVEIINTIEKKRSAEESTPLVVILIPPNHGKTTLLTDWICYKLATDPNHRILYISETAGHAIKVINRVKRRMTEPKLCPAYIAKFGPFYVPGQESNGKPWTGDYFTVFNANHDEQDYSLEAKGWKAQIYGGRYDTVILDDVQSITTLNQTEKILEKIQQDIVTRPDPDKETLIAVIGTRVGQRDVYIGMIDGDMVDDVIVRPVQDSTGKLLWPSRFTKEKLAGIRKKVKEKVWWRAYMMRPQDDGTATFTEAMMENVKDRTLVVPGKARDDRPVVAALDPALGGGNALLVAHWTPEQIELLDCDKRYDLARTEDIMEVLDHYWIRYRYTDLIIESVAFQKGLARDERFIGEDGLCRRRGFTIHEHVTGINKILPDYGVASMAGAFLRREFVLPWGDQDTADKFEQYVAEHIAWRPNIPTKFLEQDFVMTSWFMWRWWMDRCAAEGMDEDSFSTAGLPFKALGLPGGPTMYNHDAYAGRY